MGRELKGRAFIEPFAPADWPEMFRVLDEVAGSSTPMVGGVVGKTADKRLLGLELLLLPLRHRGRTEMRMLGSLAAHTLPYWATLTPLASLRIASTRIIDNLLEAQVIGKAGMLIPGPRTAVHLRVLPGGRT
jgi:hypothetical protein